MEKRGDGVLEDVLHARPPGVGPEVLEGFDDSRDDQGPLCGEHSSEWIQSNRVIPIAGVKVEEIPSAFGRDRFQQALDEISMRIDHSDSVSLGNVLEDEIAKQGSFSRTRFSDNVAVVSRIGRRKAESDVSGRVVVLRDGDSWFVHGTGVSPESAGGRVPLSE